MSENKSINYEIEISNIASSLHREFSGRLNALTQGGEMNISHIAAFELLFETGAHRMSDIAKVLKLTMGAVTATIDKLVSMQFVVRHHSKEDRRVVVVSLTEKGKRKALAIKKDRLLLIKDLFKPLTDTEKRAYLKILKKIYRGIKKGK